MKIKNAFLFELYDNCDLSKNSVLISEKHE